jgi:lysophospholipid acyltransferase (LPLAT)-like uncharacterized protein
VSRDELKLQLVSRTGSAFLSALGTTLRFDVEGAEHYRRLRAAGQPLIFALWHSRLLPLVHLHRNEGVVALVSNHRDGEYIARVMHRRGFGTARGSSTRGGAQGMRQLIRVARSGRDLAITPDGPRGPARVFKMGAITLARVGGLPIVPVTAGCSRSWRAGSWDRLMVPKPFARLPVRYDPPVYVPRDADEDELERLRQQLEATLNRITDEVDGVGEVEP